MRRPNFAFFSMEYGIDDSLPIFAGGLGILAGDMMKSSADLGLEGAFVGLIYRLGYFRQELRDGWQMEHYDNYDPSQHMTKLPHVVEVHIEDRTVNVGGWRYLLKGRNGNIFPGYLLDTDVEGNSEADKRITGYLYGSDEEYRLKQELVLGIGGVKMLQALGEHPDVYHINEGHGAFVMAEMLNEGLSLEEIKQRVVFTTHTPVAAGHDHFCRETVDRVVNGYFPQRIKNVIQALSGGQELNMTLLAMNTSGFRNAVSKLHLAVTRNMFSRNDIEAITNGVHAYTWTSAPFQHLYDRLVPEWRADPAALAKVAEVPRNQILAAHRRAKLIMLNYVSTKGQTLHPNILTIGFARRYATYKRGSLLFHDIERLLEIGNGKLQLVFAGKAHPQDEPGKRIIHSIHEAAEKLKGKIPVIFLDNYSMHTGKLITAGCDVWLNAPLVGYEASGTSGMKAALNGVLHCSTDDGWWAEANHEAGWTFGDGLNNDDADANSLYRVLSEHILPEFNDPDQWVRRMRIAIGQNGVVFNTERSMKEYAKVYEDLRTLQSTPTIPPGSLTVPAMRVNEMAA